MQLSLSGRIVEAEHIKTDACPWLLPAFAELAARVGFQAVCVRSTHLNSTTPLERAREMRGILAREWPRCFDGHAGFPCGQPGNRS